LTLDPAVIAPGFANDGQDVPVAGQVASLTSTNNFINFCLLSDSPITNGQQIVGGSCNPTPIGLIPSVNNMPSAKFAFPPNFGTIQANTLFTVEMNIRNLETGFFVNAQKNYFAAPQVLNSNGQIQGHSHVVIEQITSLEQTQPTDPRVFAFFKGLNAAAEGGKLTAEVTMGLPVGVYRLTSINTSTNHQPVIVPVAQHGGLDDAIYFTITEDGNPPPGADDANDENADNEEAADENADGAEDENADDEAAADENADDANAEQEGDANAEQEGDAAAEDDANAGEEDPAAADNEAEQADADAAADDANAGQEDQDAAADEANAEQEDQAAAEDDANAEQEGEAAADDANAGEEDQAEQADADAAADNANAEQANADAEQENLAAQ
jgi:hypothetical protein